MLNLEIAKEEKYSIQIAITAKLNSVKYVKMELIL